MPVKSIPDGYHTVTPYLIVDDAAALIEFAKAAFGAREHHVMRAPGGSVVHADVVIGDSHVMIGQAGGPNRAFPATLYLYVADCDATYGKALAAGATSIQELATQFYGDRHGAVADRWGNRWWIVTHVEDVSDAELQRRTDEAMRQRGQATT